MKTQDIQIIRLGPMRVASIMAHGTFPEKEAWRKLIAHRDLKNLINNRNEHPVFGFSNRQPSGVSSEFDYEIWVKTGPEFEPEEPLPIIDFPGGLYAVTRCLIGDIDYLKRYRKWKNLINRCKNKEFRPGYHQSLEKFINLDSEFQNLVLDLYYPIIY